jgi:hypothetical protein
VDRHTTATSSCRRLETWSGKKDPDGLGLETGIESLGP